MWLFQWSGLWSPLRLQLWPIKIPLTWLHLTRLTPDRNDGMFYRGGKKIILSFLYCSLYSRCSWSQRMRQDCAGPQQTCAQGRTLLFWLSWQARRSNRCQSLWYGVKVSESERQRERETEVNIQREERQNEKKGHIQKGSVGEKMRIQMNLLHPMDKLSGFLSLSLALVQCVWVCVCVFLTF